MFGQHVNTESPVDAAGIAGDSITDHRADGVASLAVNSTVAVSPVDPFTAMLSNALGESVPVYKGEIIGINDVTTGDYEVSVPCTEHGQHLYRAGYTGTDTESPDEGTVPVLFVIEAVGGEAEH